MVDQDRFLARFKQRLQDEFISIERNQSYSEEEKIDRLIFTTSALCAGIAVQPVPFADMPILTTIQGLMGYKIAQVRGINLSQESAREVLKYLGGVLGAGLAAQHFVLALWKIGIPGAGGFMTIPVVFGVTYGIGRAMDLYFRMKKIGRIPSRPEILEAFKMGKREGKQDAKHRTTGDPTHAVGIESQ